MTDKAIITRRGTDGTAAVDDIHGLTVEQRVPQGTLVSGEPIQLEALARRGFRVKLLRDTNILEIGTFRIDTEARAPRTAARLDVPSGARDTWTHHLVQLVAPPSEEWVHAIEEQGVDVVEPVSAYGLFVVGSAEQVSRLMNLPFVQWTGPFKPAYRLARNLEGVTGRVRHLNIGVYPETAADSVRAVIHDAGGEVVAEDAQEAAYRDLYRVLLVELDAKKIPDVARHPNVRWIEHQPPDRATDERSSQIVAENLDGAAPPNTAPVAGYQAALATLGLSGAGVTIGIVDTGVDTHNNAAMQADLAGRLAFFVDTTGGALTVDVDGHGTHVAGIAVGNAATGDTDPQGFLLGQGVAPGAQFGSINVIETGGVLSDDNRVKNVVINGGQVMNNSWGASAAAGYTGRSRTYDLRLRDPNPAAAGLEYVVIVSATGNSGSGATTVLNPWEAKNPITVGNSLNFRPGEGAGDDIRGVRNSSSRGPAVDGRLLPTIVAPGTDIISARPTVDADTTTPSVQRPRNPYTDTGGTVHENHYRNSGTSMAAPHVAGLCALLIEWWRNRTGGKNPSAALLKALLVNGAEDLAGGPDGAGGTLTNVPNNIQGWGRVSLENMVLQAPASGRGPKIFSDQKHAFTANGQEYNIRVAPVDGTRPMRITLAWTDAAGAANASPALVNDLDLEVTELATGNIYRGNVFAGGFSTTGGAFDARNNVECVFVQNPTGTYDVTVIGATIAASANPGIATPWQDFALVIDNAEVSAAAPVSVVSVIDRSGSMVSAGYVDVTLTSSKQFVDLMSVDDRLAVISFGSATDIEYPSAAPLTLQTIAGQPTRDAAKAEIDGISFGGCTFMGEAINQARDLLTTEGGTRVMVLLSDGYDNKGCDPTNPAKPSAIEAAGGLPANMPIYTCAMGPASDQTLLADVASVTGGRYFYMPTIDDLFEIYNYIRGQITGDGIIVNESTTASASNVDAFVDSAASEATISVAWANTRLRYVSDDPRRANHMAVRLRDPRGRRVHGNASFVRRIVGDGYVVFKLAEPLPGRWRVEVETVAETHVRYTVGGFVRSPLRLALDSRLAQLAAGAPLRVAARVFDGRDPITVFTANAQITAPTFSIGNLLKEHARPLQSVRVPSLPGGDRVPADIARLSVLRSRLVADKRPDIFAPTLDRIALRREFATPARTAEFRRTQEPGSYNVAVTVSGRSPNSDTRFMRKELVSIIVRDHARA